MEPKKVIIVGASSGIGREIACIYAERGWKVAITGRRKNLLEEVKQKYPSIIYSCFDVMGNDNIKHISSLIEEMGGMDLLIYNSGFGDTSKSLDPEIDRTTILTNVVGFVDIVGLWTDRVDFIDSSIQGK
jgi:NADP-dependent 3-hydroxy acid dehydrogenase YdfG